MLKFWFLKILLIIAVLLLIEDSWTEENEEEEMKTQVTLHFSADNRLPYDWFADWIVFDAFIRGVYGTLTYLTPNGLFDIEHEDSLIEYIQTDKGNPTQIIIGVRKGLYFESTEEKIEFTSEDIKFSYSIPFFLKHNDIFEKSDLMKIEGMKKIIAGETYSDDKVTGIEIIDKYTLKIYLSHADPNIITNLSTSKYPIVSKYFFLKRKNDELTPGLGKYRVLELNKNTGEVLLQRKISLKGYPDYIKFIASADNKGDVFWRDMWGNFDSRFKREVIDIPYGTVGVFFNYNSKLGKNKKFREAISLAINRKKLCDGSDSVIPNNQTLPNGYWGRIDLIENQNVELAKKMLSEIKDIPNPLIIASGANNEEHKKPHYVNLKQQLIDVGLNPVFSIAETYKPFETDLIVAGISVPYKYPSSVFQFFLEGSSFTNAYPLNDKNIKFLFEKLNLSNSDKEKIYYSKEISKYINENHIFIPLWDILTEFIINDKKIKSLGNQPGGMVFDIWKIKINE